MPSKKEQEKNMASKIFQNRSKIYEGSSKIIYESGNSEDSLIQFFKDDMILPNGETIDISGKGILKNNISAFIMEKMGFAGIETHYMEKLNMREQMIKLVEIVPVHICVSNIAAGRYVSEFGIEEGYVFGHPITDFRIKNRTRGYPAINEHQLIHFGWVEENEIDELMYLAFRINDFLTGLFAGIGIRFVECNLEIGRIFDGMGSKFILADEITPDNCRLWDASTNQKLDFEYTISSPDKAISVYNEIANRFKL